MKSLHRNAKHDMMTANKDARHEDVGTHLRPRSPSQGSAGTGRCTTRPPYCRQRDISACPNATLQHLGRDTQPAGAAACARAFTMAEDMPFCTGILGAYPFDLVRLLHKFGSTWIRDIHGRRHSRILDDSFVRLCPDDPIHRLSGGDHLLSALVSAKETGHV